MKLRSPVLKGTLVAGAVGAVLAATVLVLTFQAPFMVGRHGHARAISLARAACASVLVAYAALFLQRHRVDALLGRLQAHVRRTVDASGLVSPPMQTSALAWAWVGLAVAAGLVSIAIAVVSPSAYRIWIREDGAVEYGTSVAWYGAAVCTAVALFVDRSSFPLKLLVYVPLALLFVFAGGEEISWGQRLFHYQVPVLVETVNKQREMNVHDIGSISVKETGFFVFTTICCWIVPQLLARAPEWRTYLRLLNAPIVDPFVARAYGIGLLTWLIIGVRFGTLGFSPLSLWGYYTQMDDEIWEFFSALGFLSLASLDLAHRLAGSQRLTPGTPRTSTEP